MFDANKISKVNCTYGAPMGRRSYDDTDEAITKVRLSRLPFVDGCYDQGGAYWGSPADVWRLRDREGKIQQFIRAPNRKKAAETLQEEFPNIRLIRPEKRSNP